MAWPTVSFIVPGYTPGRFVLTDAIEFPFQGEASEATSVAYQRVHDRMLAKYDEHKGVKVLGVFTHGPGQIFNTKRAVTSLKDLEGMKIRVGGGMVNEVAKALGTVPMLKPAPESYELLAQGVADGVFFPKEAAFVQARPADQARHLHSGRPLQRQLHPDHERSQVESDLSRPTGRRSRSSSARRWRGAPARRGTLPINAARRRSATPTSRW